MRPDLSRRPLGKLRFDLFATVKQALDRAVLIGLLIKPVKNRLDCPQHYMQGHTAFLPALDQRPIKRRKQQILAPPTDKRVFDLCEIVVVVQRICVKLRLSRKDAKLAKRPVSVKRIRVLIFC